MVRGCEWDGRNKWQSRVLGGRELLLQGRHDRLCKDEGEAEMVAADPVAVRTASGKVAPPRRLRARLAAAGEERVAAVAVEREAERRRSTLWMTWR